MATKADFSEDEWEAMQRGVSGAGMLVSLADRDFTDSFGEAKALAKYLAAEHEQSESTLMRDVAAMHGTKFGVGTSPAKLEAETFGALSAATAALAAKAPEESGNYRALVLGVAEHVAEAKGGKSAPEEEAIAKIADAVGTA